MEYLTEGQLPKCEACINFRPNETSMDMGLCIINPPILLAYPDPSLNMRDTQGRWPRIYKEQCCAKGIFLINYGTYYAEHTYDECLALNRTKK